MRRTIAIIILSLLSAWLIWDRFDTGITAQNDERDQIVDSLRTHYTEALEAYKDSVTAVYVDTLTIIKTETVYQTRERFIDYYGEPDTVQVFDCDSAQMAQANENKVRLDSCRLVAKVLGKQLGECDMTNQILLRQRSDERERVRLLEALNNTKWWQVVKQCRIKRKLKRG